MIELGFEFGIGANDVECSLGQRGDLVVDRLDVPLDALLDGRRRIRDDLVRMESILFLGSVDQECLDSPREST